MAADQNRPVNQPRARGESRDADDRAPGGCEVEARLDSLLADPTVQLLMKRDGVERDVLLRAVQVMRRRVEGERQADRSSSDER